MEKKQIIVFVVLVTIATFVLIILSPKKQELPQDITSQDIKSIKKRSKKQREKAREKQRKIIERYRKKQKKRKAARSTKINFKNYDLQREKSEVVKKKFLKEIYLKGTLPKRFIYSEMDLDTDDPVKIMIGEHPFEDEHLVIGATTVVPPKAEDIITYVNEYKNAFPHINQSLLSQLKPTIKVNNPRPGLKQLNVWEAHNPGTDRAEVIVYLARSDERGSYILSYSGKTSMLEENEDYIDELLQSLKPKKAPKNIYNQQ